MTPKQQIRAAKFVFVNFSTANGSNVNLAISKGELLRFMRVDGADPTDDELWDWQFTPGGSLFIVFRT